MVLKFHQLIKKFKSFNLKITNTYSLLKPCFLLYKTCGLFPYTKSNNDILLCNVGLCFSIFIGIICTTYLFGAMYQSIISEELEFDSVEGLLQFNCYFILGAFITAYTSVSYKSRLFLLKKIIEVSVILTEIELQNLMWGIYRIVILGYIFLIAQFPHIYSDDLVLFVSKIYAMFITIVVFLMDMQYMTYVMILKMCFKNINNCIRELKISDIKKRNNVGEYINYLPSHVNLQLLKLRKLQLRHHSVSNLVKQLNIVFALHIIATVLMTFIEVTFGLYFFILHSQGRKGIDLEKQVWYNYFITSVAYYSLKILILVSVCQNAKNEASRTGIIVHDVILSKDDDQFVAEVKRNLIRFYYNHVFQSNTFFSICCSS